MIIGLFENCPCVTIEQQNPLNYGFLSFKQINSDATTGMEKTAWLFRNSCNTSLYFLNPVLTYS